MPQTRRQFLGTTAGLVGGSLASGTIAAQPGEGFSFILLGDLHFDRLEHHDLGWVEAEKPGDVAQIRNYSRLTAVVMPLLFAGVRRQIEWLRTTDTPPRFVLQVGDLVEGLCGNEELAVRQNREALEFVAAAILGLPLLFTKGNHDVTGPGSDAAFDAVLQPFQREQALQVDALATSAGANVSLTHAGSQWACFDAYDNTSLDWLEAVLAQRTAERLFVVVHPPVVPYGARAMWHLYSSKRDAAKRAKLLELLGRHDAIILGGHLHKFAALTRTVGTGRFTQLAVSSVVSAPDERPRDELQGGETYSPDQVQLEPRHSPETINQRRRIYELERPHVTSFEYAHSAGYAVVRVTPDAVHADVYAGTGGDLMRTISLAARV
jgi:3',5'-cyclic AMP phosphodiesterase CpdA